MSSESKESVPHKKKEFRCSLCRVTCLTDWSYLEHHRGARHSKALRSYRGRDYDQKPLKKLTSLKDFINDPDRDEPLIGLQYVEEGRKIRAKRHYRCTLCDQDMAMQVMFDHLIGHKHRRSYLNKHFPLLIKGVQTPTVLVVKALAKEVEEQEGLQTYATNVPIKLQPHTAKKHSKTSSEDFSSQSDPLEPMLTDPLEPMLTDADDVLDYMENVFAMTGSLLPPWEPVPEQDNSYKKHDSRSSSPDSEYSSKRHKDHSPSRRKRSENSTRHHSSREREHSSKHRSSREHSSKRHKDHSLTPHKKHSSSRDADHSSKKKQDSSPSSHEADQISKRDKNRSSHLSQKRSTSRETDHVSRRDRDYSSLQYQYPESSRKYSSHDRDSKSSRDSAPHKSKKNHRSRD